ncbi:hypothetical protein L209DRAFT_138774 [Thermothelomyces heterothallicus CBS 203.75]
MGRGTVLRGCPSLSCALAAAAAAAGGLLSFWFLADQRGELSTRIIWTSVGWLSVRAIVLPYLSRRTEGVASEKRISDRTKPLTSFTHVNVQVADGTQHVMKVRECVRGEDSVGR